MCGCLPCAPSWDLACNPGMGHDWESNWRSFGSQAGTKSTEPHQPGHSLIIYFLLAADWPDSSECSASELIDQTGIRCWSNSSYFHLFMNHYALLLIVIHCRHIIFHISHDSFSSEPYCNFFPFSQHSQFVWFYSNLKLLFYGLHFEYSQDFWT